MTFPTHDWQFYVATAIAICALVWLLRRFLPGATVRKRRRGKRTVLTIEGRAVEPGVSTRSGPGTGGVPRIGTKSDNACH